jgi:hypothetical protein
MADSTPTYTFEGDEVFAIFAGQVIASGEDIDEVEQSALEYLDAHKVTADADAKADKKRKATHIVTPNGVEGQIMGRTPTVWGEQITVRLANGTISHYNTRGDETYITKKEASTDQSPIELLEQRLAAEYDHGKAGLVERLHELRDVAQEATRLASAGAPYSIERQLDTIRTSAVAESAEVKTALDYLESSDAESFIPDAPFQMHAAEQVEFGHRSNDWLEVVAADMVEEAKGTDFEKLMTEGPGVFVADLEPATLADAGTVRELAYSHIIGKTAGFEGDEVVTYRNDFVARVEAARRREASAHKATTKKEAAVEHEAHVNAPDEALFM